MRLHPMGLSAREVVAVLDLLGIDPSHGAIWNWTHELSGAQSDPPTVEPSRVAVDEKQIQVDGEKSVCTPRSTQNRSSGSKPTYLAAAGLTSRRRFCTSSLETQYRRGRVSRQCWRLSDCPRSPRIERSAQLQRAKHRRKVVSDSLNADRPLSRLLAGQSSQRTPLAQTLQTPL